MKGELIVKRLILFLSAVLCACMFAASAQCAIRVVATTTLIECALKDIGGKNVSVDVVMSGSACPGHFDISPGDIKKFSGSRAVFMHGFEGFVGRVVGPMKGAKPKIIKVPESGNWMVPAVYSRALETVAKRLSEIDPKNKKQYYNSLAKRKNEATAAGKAVIADMKRIKASSIKTICAGQQAEFAQWLGLDVVTTFDRPEAFTPKTLHALAELGRKSGVRLVIDNLQSGPNACKQLAADIGAKHVNLSNFPGGYKSTSTWKLCLLKNVQLLKAATK